MSILSLFATAGGAGATAGAVGSKLLGGSAIGMMGAGLATGAIVAGKTFDRLANQGSRYTNPMFAQKTVQGYGKRGIDANNMNTGGLSLSLHKNRRKF